MILVDVNLLIYAVNEDSAHHRAARYWLEETLSTTTIVGFPWIVTRAFVRITTRSGIFESPLSPEAALEYVDDWLGHPFSKPIGPGANHWPILRSLLRNSGSAGNLTSDAHIAALAIETGSAIYSTDNDFKRFAGVEHINPLVR